REALAGVLDVNGCTTMDGADAFVHHALLRSLAPDKPVFNTAERLIPPVSIQGADAFAYVHARLWEGAMAGLNGCLTPLGAPYAPGRESDGLLSHPECLDGFATACMDLNRLAPIVSAFQRAPANVAVLWSNSSKIRDDGDPYLDSVKCAFTGCSWFGYGVRFVSERQCEEGALDAVDVFIIPKTIALTDAAFAAIDAYIQAGGVTVRAGSFIPYNERGASRQGVLSSTTRAILVRGADSPLNYLHGMDAAYEMGALEPVPRSVNAHGYPLEGVRSRFALADGAPFLYLVNLRSTPVTVYLDGPYCSGRDLIGARWVGFPTVVEPNDPMLIRLDAPPEVEVAEEEAPERAIPTVALRPVGRTGSGR
ncbi:MAG: hypothetical protein JXR94_08270, partial [Candidatus Hydrogenedentes bacterium]|nr:hypothetical protein [Candidatus Hydrogenedentota bacterium]